MIRVTFYLREDQLTGFEVKGHAGYAEEGYDIICSAVSALSVNAVNSLEALTEDALSVRESEDGGYLSCMVASPEEGEDASGQPSEAALLLLESLRIGLLSIEETYGDDFLKIREVSL